MMLYTYDVAGANGGGVAHAMGEGGGFCCGVHPRDTDQPEELLQRWGECQGGRNVAT